MGDFRIGHSGECCHNRCPMSLVVDSALLDHVIDCCDGCSALLVVILLNDVINGCCDGYCELLVALIA